MHEQLREQLGDQIDEVNMAGWCVAREEVAPYNAHPPDSFGELFDVPDTLQDYLNARLDSLGDAKPIAQIAAVFGGDFRYEWIDAVAKQNHLDADAAMDELSAQDILSIPADNTEDRYEFRHSLFQEAAYHSLLKKTRKLYHRQIAELLSQQGEGKQTPRTARASLCAHRRQGRAVDLWLGAGRRAITRAMLHDALAHIERGRRLLSSLPNGARRKRRELELLLNRAVALTAGAGYHGDAVTSAYQRALLLANDAGTERQTWAALYGLWRCRVSQARFADALRLLARLKMLCRQSRDAKLELTTCGLQAMTRMVAGKFGAAERFYNRAVALYDASRDKNMGVRFGQDPYLTIRGLGAVNKLLRNQLSESLDEIACSVDAAARGWSSVYDCRNLARSRRCIDKSPAIWTAYAPPPRRPRDWLMRISLPAWAQRANVFGVLRCGRRTKRVGGASDGDASRKLSPQLRRIVPAVFSRATGADACGAGQL